MNAVSAEGARIEVVSDDSGARSGFVYDNFGNAVGTISEDSTIEEGEKLLIVTFADGTRVAL